MKVVNAPIVYSLSKPSIPLITAFEKYYLLFTYFKHADVMQVDNFLKVSLRI